MARHRRPRPVGRQLDLLRQVRKRLASRTTAAAPARSRRRPHRPAPPAATACSRRTAPAAATAPPQRPHAAPGTAPPGPAPADRATSRRRRCGAAPAAARARHRRQLEQMRPQRQLARQIEAPPGRGRQRRRKPGLIVDRARPQAAAAPHCGAQDLLPRHPEPLREHACAGSRAARPDRPAPPPAPRGRASPRAAPPAGSCSTYRRRRCRRPPAAPGTTAAAAHRTAGSRQAAAHRHQRRHAPRAASDDSRAASAATLGASNRLRIGTSTPSAARIRLISRVASSECPPSSKKLSSTPTRSTPQHLGKQRAQDRLLRRPRRHDAHATATKLRRRQRPAVELAVRRQRQPLQHHERRRHHVVRQLPRQRRPQRRGVQRRARRRHHIADQPLAARRRPSRATTAACAHARPAAAAPPRSRPARSGSRASSPARRRGPGTPARRPAATAPGPRSGTSARPAAPNGSGDEPLRRQPRPVQVAARQPDAPDVQLARPRPPAPAQARRPAHRPACSRSAGRSAPRATGRPPQAQRVTSIAASVGPYRLSSCTCGRRRATRSRSSAGSASPLQITTPQAGQRTRAAGSAPRTCSRNACSIDGTKCSVVTPLARGSSRRAAPDRGARPARATTSRAPTISGQKNSHTDTSKLNGVFCSTTSSPVSPIGVLHPGQPVARAPRAC